MKKRRLRESKHLAELAHGELRIQIQLYVPAKPVSCHFIMFYHLGAASGHVGMVLAQDPGWAQLVGIEDLPVVAEREVSAEGSVSMHQMLPESVTHRTVGDRVLPSRSSKMAKGECVGV